MPDNRYDIFISYRRDGGAQYARILQLELEKRGYKVFLDYEELTDGVFGDNIKDAICEAPIFIMVLSAHYLDRCKNEGDWVREEIMLAANQQKHFIPINPDNAFDGIPADIPDEIKQIVSSHQHSEVNFGQLLGASIDRMVKNRIITKAKPRQRQIRQKFLYTLAVFVVVAIGLVLWGYARQRIKFQEETEAYRHVLMMEATPWGQYFNWNERVTIEQLLAITSIINNMVEVKGGEFMQGAIPDDDGSYDEDVDRELDIPASKKNVSTFWMGMYEVTCGEWHRILQTTFEASDSLLPVSNVTYEECIAFTEKLSDLTGVEFHLPTETEWEYAARGGNEPDNTKYAGSDDPNQVSWYGKNAGGKPHVCRADNSPMTCNGLNLFDMSGNVSEWCNTEFRPYNPSVAIPDPDAKTIRGGDFLSESYAITVYHREPMNPKAKSETVGLRLVVYPNP